MAVATFAPAGEPRWIDEALDGDGIDAPVWLRYALAFYWALSMTVGEDLGPTTSHAELVYAIACRLIGACTMGYIISELSALLGALDKQTALVDEKMDTVKEYLQWRKVPPALRTEVRRYYSNFYHHRSVFDEEAILGNLMQDLRVSPPRMEPAPLACFEPAPLASPQTPDPSPHLPLPSS
jgi:hypothetical protein